MFAASGNGSGDVEASPRKTILKGLQEGFLQPSETFTGQQIFYLLVPHGLVAAIISGTVNFAIGVGKFCLEVVVNSRNAELVSRNVWDHETIYQPLPISQYSGW